jgi:hypothetical protein
MEIYKLKQWVVWKWEGKQKVPYCPRTGRKASVTDSSTWGTFEDAELVWDGYWGVGFVFTMDDPYCGIDLDDCIDPNSGEIAPWAAEIIEALDSYAEVSPSGTGIKVWVRATKPGPRCKTEAFEIYDSGHYFTFTGRQYDKKHTIESRQDEVDVLYRRYFPIEEREQGEGHGFQGDDDELLEKMRNSGHWRTFRQLFDYGNFEDYHSQSEADLRLCTILAFWIGPDEDRIEEWFMESALAGTLDRKPDPNDYIRRTIIQGIVGCDYFYDPNYAASPTVRDALTEMMGFVLDYRWPGRSGPTDKDVYRALLRAAWRYGAEQEDGIKVSVSDRDLTLEAGLGSNKTARAAVRRLIDKHRLIRCMDSGGKRRARTYLLYTDRANLHHNLDCVYYDVGSRTPLTALTRIRNAGRSYGTIGKRNSQIIDLIHCAGERLSLDKLAQHLNMRKSDLRRRNIQMLSEAGFITGTADAGYVTVPDIEDQLARFLEESKSNAAEKLVQERIEREREAWRYYEHKEIDMQKVDTHRLGCTCEDCTWMREDREAIEVFHGQFIGEECTYSLGCPCFECYLNEMLFEELDGLYLDAPSEILTA